MDIFSRLLGRKARVPATTTKSIEETNGECPHVALMGRWDSAADMGKEEKVTAFLCDACHKSFSPDEGRQLRATTAERIHAEDIERVRRREER